MDHCTCCCRWYSAPEVNGCTVWWWPKPLAYDRGRFRRYPGPRPSGLHGDALPIGSAAPTRGYGVGRLRPLHSAALPCRRRRSRRVRCPVAQYAAGLDAEGEARPRHVGRLLANTAFTPIDPTLAGWLFTIAGPTALATIAAAILVLSVVVVPPIPGVADLGSPATTHPRDDATVSYRSPLTVGHALSATASG